MKPNPQTAVNNFKSVVISMIIQRPTWEVCKNFQGTQITNLVQVYELILLPLKKSGIHCYMQEIRMTTIKHQRNSEISPIKQFNALYMQIQLIKKLKNNEYVLRYHIYACYKIQKICRADKLIR